MISLLDLAIEQDPEAPWHALLDDWAPPERAIRGFDGLRFWRALSKAARMTGEPLQQCEASGRWVRHGPRFPWSLAWR